MVSPGQTKVVSGGVIVIGSVYLIHLENKKNSK